jgi:hypothetical protein
VAFCTLQLEPKVWVVPMEIEIWARAQLSSPRRAKRVNECRVLLGRLIVLSRSFKQGPSFQAARVHQNFSHVTGRRKGAASRRRGHSRVVYSMA